MNKLTAIGALAFACASLPSYAQSSDVMTGIDALSCKALLCLSSSLRPGECNEALSHYFDIKKYTKGILDLEKTINARFNFLAICPMAVTPEITERRRAIARGAGRCDPEFLNATYGKTIYRYKSRNWGFGSSYYDISAIQTVTMSALPSYCVAYNDHAWTYDLSTKYVGNPQTGGYWVKASDYDAAQAKWNAEHSGMVGSSWLYSEEYPRSSSSGHEY